METVFGGKVGHGKLVVPRNRLKQSALFLLHVLTKHIHHIIVPANVVGIGAGLFQKLAGKLPEHLVRIVAAFLPGLSVECLEEHSCARIPAPPKIFRQFIQTCKTFRQMGKQRFHSIYFFHIL